MPVVRARLAVISAAGRAGRVAVDGVALADEAEEEAAVRVRPITRVGRSAGRRGDAGCVAAADPGAPLMAFPPAAACDPMLPHVASGCSRACRRGWRRRC